MTCDELTECHKCPSTGAGSFNAEIARYGRSGYALMMMMIMMIMMIMIMIMMTRTTMTMTMTMS